MHLRKLLVIICILLTTSSFSQDSLNKFKTSGFWTGYGFELNPNINYRVYYLAGEFSFPFNKKPKKNFLSWYLEPQFNFVNTDRTDVELGMNIGLKNTIRLSPDLLFYQVLGSGPHFITAQLTRQATGFIFSDNFGLGLLKRLKKSGPVFLNVQLRYRHLSNASFKKPNAGIDNVNLVLGISGVGEL